MSTDPRPVTLWTAIVYDRDRDSWRVETKAAEDEGPRYPEAVPIFTEEDGKRHEGLIPPAKYRMLDRHGAQPKWRGPVALRSEGTSYQNHPWRVQLFTMGLPLDQDTDRPIDVEVRIDNRTDQRIPQYKVLVKEARFSL